MKYFEIVMKYLIGIEIGLISIEDFADFIDDQISELENVPDIYIEISLNINKGIKELSTIISNYCYENRMDLTQNQTDKITKDILTIIKEKYLNEEINTKECVEFMHKLSLQFNDLSKMNCIEDYYNLAIQGIVYTLEDVENMITQIFKENSIT